jgi:hypothetical protein
MRLEKLQVTNFRCIDDSTEFNVSDVTCLVGKNESGKNAILQAIERLNPQDPQHADYDLTRDYPRRYLNDYRERHQGQAARVVRSVWSLTDREIARLEAAFGKRCLTAHSFEMERRYEPKRFGTIPLDEPKVLKRLIQQAGCTPKEATALGEFKTVKALHNHITNLGEGVSDQQRALLNKLTGFPDLSLQRAAWGIVEMPKFMYFSNYDRMSGDVSI